jgi:hypothetical protein
MMTMMVIESISLHDRHTSVTFNHSFQLSIHSTMDDSHCDNKDEDGGGDADNG